MPSLSVVLESIGMSSPSHLTTGCQTSDDSRKRSIGLHHALRHSFWAKLTEHSSGRLGLVCDLTLRRPGCPWDGDAARPIEQGAGDHEKVIAAAVIRLECPFADELPTQMGPAESMNFLGSPPSRPAIKQTNRFP